MIEPVDLNSYFSIADNCLTFDQSKLSSINDFKLSSFESSTTSQATLLSNILSNDIVLFYNKNKFNFDLTNFKFNRTLLIHQFQYQP